MHIYVCVYVYIYIYIYIYVSVLTIYSEQLKRQLSEHDSDTCS